MKVEDYQREPCWCGECKQAGVWEKPQLRDPQTAAWLHGYALKALYDAADRCLDTIRGLKAGR